MGMLIKYFHTNRPGILLLLPLFVAILWFPFYYYQVPATSKLLSPYVFILKRDLILDGWAGTIAAAAASVFCAILLNRIAINSEISSKPTYIYAFAYVMAESFTRTDSGFYTWQISQFILIFTLWPLLKIFNQRHVIDLGFEAGMLSGIAFLFCPPCLPFFLIIYFFLQRFRPFNWREWTFPVIGFALMLFFYFAWCYVSGKKPLTLYIFSKFDYTTFFYAQPGVLIFFAVLLLISLGSYIRGSLRAIIHARKQRLVLLYLFILFVVSVTLFNLNKITNLGYCFAAFPAALFMGHYFGHARNRWLAELLFILACAILVSRFSV